MPRRMARCTEVEIRRAWSVARAAGPSVAVDILPDGTIRLHEVAQKEGLEVVALDSESPRVMF